MNQTGSQQRGARWGWIGGLLGATVWIPIVSGVLLHRGDVLGGLGGLLCYCLVLLIAYVLRPWRWPAARLWKLYVVVVGSLLGAAAFLVWRYRVHVDPYEDYTIGFFGIFPLLLPAILFGRRTWGDPRGPQDPD